MSDASLALMTAAGWLFLMLVGVAAALHLRRGIDDHAASAERSTAKQTAALESALRKQREPAPASSRRIITGLIPPPPPSGGKEDP